VDKNHLLLSVVGGLPVTGDVFKCFPAKYTPQMTKENEHHRPVIGDLVKGKTSVSHYTVKFVLG
jgi:hypothetical protein